MFKRILLILAALLLLAGVLTGLLLHGSDDERNVGQFNEPGDRVERVVLGK